MDTRVVLSTSAALLVALVVVIATMGLTAASFTDQVTSEGPTLTAAKLEPPLLLTPTLDGSDVDLEWTAGDDVAEAYEIFRYDGACPGGWPGDPPGEPLATVEDPPSPPPTMYTDTSVVPGSTYCYAVRGAVGERWTSEFSGTEEIEVPLPENTLHPNTGAALSTVAPESGSSPFGCALVGGAGLLCVADHPGAYVYQSQVPYHVYSNSGWEVQISVGTSGISIFSSYTFDVAIWYETGACNAPPAGGSANLIATGSIERSQATLGGAYTIPLTVNEEFAQPSGARTICLQIASEHQSVLTLLGSYRILHSLSTYLEGPFEP